MAVPCGDERDFKFARHFNILITNIIGSQFTGEEANPTKDAILENSGFLNGMLMRDAIPVVNAKLESLGIGNPRINYKMRDAAFSRQRYWGEPFPIIWKNGIAYPLDEKDFFPELPKVDSQGRPDGEDRWPICLMDSQTSESNTMPGYAAAAGIFTLYGSA
jgi:leucyl-tRNA synthetase